nr:pescadillo-like protein [Tanacetum cinerariifolium]
MERTKEKKKKEEGECDSEPPREPRWSDENLAMHIWRGVCWDKGVKCHEYALRTDYANMTREEIQLDLLWRKVYQAEEAEEEAAEAEKTSTTS